MGIIYILKNKINDKCYIGQTNQSFDKRLKQHLRSNTLIGTVLKKYGVNVFDKILLENIPEEQLDYLEIDYIQKYNSLVPNGYNFETGGHKNKHLGEETKRKLSRAHKGKLHTKKSKEKMSEAKRGNLNWLGKKHSKETKIKIGEAHRGVSLTEEHRKKLIGKIRSKETKRKMSEAAKGNKNHLGFKHTEKAKQKMSEAHRGKVLTEEHKRKIGYSLRKENRLER
jgi:group I intron endonuclease